MSEGISIREFARRAGCDEKVVRRKLISEHLPTLSDGTLDPAHLEVDWRSGAAMGADAADRFADNYVRQNNIEKLWSTPEAERVKENYAALLRKLSYERESAGVVETGDAALAIRSEYDVVRTRLAQVGSNVAAKLAGVRKPEEAKAIIDAEVHAALAELTDIVP